MRVSGYFFMGNLWFFVGVSRELYGNVSDGEGNLFAWAILKLSEWNNYFELGSFYFFLRFIFMKTLNDLFVRFMFHEMKSFRSLIFNI